MPQANGYKALIMTLTSCSINLQYEEILDSQSAYAKMLHPKENFILPLFHSFMELQRFSGFWETTST